MNSFWKVLLRIAAVIIPFRNKMDAVVFPNGDGLATFNKTRGAAFEGTAVAPNTTTRESNGTPAPLESSAMSYYTGAAPSILSLLKTYMR